MLGAPLQSEVARKKSNHILCTWHLLRLRMPLQRIWHSTTRVPNAGSLRGHSVLTTNIWCGGEPPHHFKDSGARSQTDCCQSWKPFFSEHQETAFLLTASPRVSTCVSIYRQCWFCIFSARCALAVRRLFPCFVRLFTFLHSVATFLSGALELVSALFSF